MCEKTAADLCEWGSPDSIQKSVLIFQDTLATYMDIFFVLIALCFTASFQHLDDVSCLEILPTNLVSSVICRLVGSHERICVED